MPGVWSAGPTQFVGQQAALQVHHCAQDVGDVCRGMGHEGDELCSYEDMGIRVAVRKLSVRWHLRRQSGAISQDDADRYEDDLRYKRSSLWNSRAWCSKSILDTRMGL